MNIEYLFLLLNFLLVCVFSYCAVVVITATNKACDTLYNDGYDAGYRAAKQKKDFNLRVCQAKQYSNQMHCVLCELTWDVNDYEPPACKFTTNLQNC